ncbi:MAG: phosphoribosyltransferase, partial [Candidatus Levyibacteriota bacterium]
MGFQEGKKAFLKYKEKINYAYQYSNLYIHSDERLRLLVNKICKNREGGYVYRKSLVESGEILGKEILTQFIRPGRSTVAIVGIPRGGKPLANGIKNEIPQAELLFTNDGAFRDADKELLQENKLSENVEFVIVVDTVVDLGTTVQRTLRFLYDKYPAKTYILVSLITAYDGAYKIEKMFPLVRHIT